MEEVEHKISVLKDAKEALATKNSIWLRELSNQTIHSASLNQDAGSIIMAVIIYSLSKLVERKDFIRIPNWDKVSERIASCFTEAMNSASNNNEEKYEDFIEKSREALQSVSPEFKHYVEEIIRKASINKASRIYEHGISLGRTAKILGLNTWDLAEYTGQNKSIQTGYNETVSQKERAKLALEFFK